MQMGYAVSPMAKLARKEMAAEYKDEALKPSRKGPVDKAATLAFTVKDVAVTKGFTKDEVLKVALAHVREMEKCYAGSSLPGKLLLKLIINPDGTVKGVHASSNTFKSIIIRQCIVEQVKKWQFPATTDGREVKVTVTLVSGS
jgi:hypothetical protein